MVAKVEGYPERLEQGEASNEVARVFYLLLPWLGTLVKDQYHLLRYHLGVYLHQLTPDASVWLSPVGHSKFHMDNLYKLQREDSLLTGRSS